EIIRVQCFVPAEVVDIAMKIRCARFSFHVYVRACSSTILRVVEGSLDFELLNGVRSGDCDAGSAERSDLGDIGAVTVRIHTVEHEVIVSATRTIGANLLAPGTQLS